MNLRLITHQRTSWRTLGIALLLGMVLAIPLVSTRTADSPSSPIPAVQTRSALPGGHATGSVYDGGAYGALPSRLPFPGSHATGSVYDGLAPGSR